MTVMGDALMDGLIAGSTPARSILTEQDNGIV